MLSADNINHVFSVEALGVVVKRNLTWKWQVDRVARSFSKEIGFLRVSKEHCKRGLKSMYQELILPHSYYCALK